MLRLEKKILEPICPEDIQRILKACRYKRDKAICLFLLDSGVRATELCMLDVDDLNMDTGEVKVRADKGQKGRSAHSFRRTFAIHSLRNGMNIYTLSKLMRHTDIAVLRPYLALVDIDLQKAQQQYGVVDHL